MNIDLNSKLSNLVVTWVFCVHLFRFNLVVFPRIVIGSTQIWVFQNPLNKPKSAKGKKTPEITYEYAQEEIAAKNGVSIGEGNSGELE